MDSKNTRATQRPATSKASSYTAPAGGTVAASQELKSSSKDKLHWAHLRGLSSEEIAKNYYLKKSYRLLRQRVKTPFAEVDLLFQDPRGNLVLVEVKTSAVSAFREYRVTQKQRDRLIRAMLFLAERYQTPVEMNWAFVTKQGVVTIVEDISG